MGAVSAASPFLDKQQAPACCRRGRVLYDALDSCGQVKLQPTAAASCHSAGCRMARLAAIQPEKVRLASNCKGFLHCTAQGSRPTCTASRGEQTLGHARLQQYQRTK